MVCLINSSDLGLIQEQLSALLKDKQEMNIEYLFGNEGLKVLVNDLNQVSLFSEPKVYVLKEANWFSGLEGFKANQEYLETLINKDAEIILVSNEAKLSTSALVQDYLKQIKVYSLKALTSWNMITYISDVAKKMNLKLSRDQIQIIANKLIPEASIIHNELSKLQNYKKLDNNLIDSVICNYDQANVFKLIEYWMTKQTNKALALYDQFIEDKYDVVMLINLMANQIYKLYLLKQASLDLSLDEEEIKKLFNLTSYGYKANMDLISYRDLNQLKYILNELYFLDLQIKQNLVDKQWVLRVWITRF